MLRPTQLRHFYRDLREPDFATALALVHSRFSTNTFPSWPLAHPYRYVCHNGEINTLRGNLTWMRVREAGMRSDYFGDAIAELIPVVAEGQSDSASFDNVLELLIQAGRPLAHAMTMLIPEAWEGDETMSAERRAFYEYHSAIMEPWDGPAAMAFTDGRQIGAVLDRNGLRPARYVVTNDDFVVLSSEAGALPFPPEKIRAKGRLQPGRMLLVNTTQGRILDDVELKEELASRRPYRRWLAEQRIGLARAADRDADANYATRVRLVRLQRAFGYTSEELRMVLAPMATNGDEPVGSMGNDTPLAVLSDRPQLLFSYFRQLFAQVTNPAIDPIREQLVMSLGMNLGPQGNLLDETPEHARQLRLDQPVLTAASMQSLRALAACRPAPNDFAALPSSPARARSRSTAAIDALCAAAAGAVRAGYGILVLSDRDIDRDRAPIPSLLAVAAVHHHLIREGLRSRVSLVVETGGSTRNGALRPARGLRRERSPPVPRTRDGRRDGASRRPRRCLGCRRSQKRTTSRPSRRVCSRSSRRWVSRRCRVTAARRSARRSAWIAPSSSATSLGRPSPVGGIGLDAIAADTLGVMRRRSAR